MKVAIFTSNQPRHLSLVEMISRVADEVFVIHECNTVHPGKVADFFRNTPVMQDYFSRVIAAENEIFGGLRFLPANVRQLALRMHDLNDVEPEVLAPALEADYAIVFGATYIKGWLADRLVERQAVNIHMGVSPYYRGSSCNFWAMYDRRPAYVGSTIHLLSKGLDSGPILFHAIPKPRAVDPFVFGMLAVKAAQTALAECLAEGALPRLSPIAQDKALQIRYTRNADFTDVVAEEYLARMPDAAGLAALLRESDAPVLQAPVFV